MHESINLRAIVAEAAKEIGYGARKGKVRKGAPKAREKAATAKSSATKITK